MIEDILHGEGDVGISILYGRNIHEEVFIAYLLHLAFVYHYN